MKRSRITDAEMERTYEAEYDELQRRLAEIVTRRDANGEPVPAYTATATQLGELKSRYAKEFEVGMATPYEHIGQLYGLLNHTLKRLDALEVLTLDRGRVLNG